VAELLRKHRGELLRKQSGEEEQTLYSTIKECLPKNRDQNVVYWVEQVGLRYRLKKTIPCQSGGGVFLAEVLVPSGSVFVNEKNQIGGRIVIP
jgi:hypothetical protein